MDKNIKEKIAFIQKIRAEHGLSADNLCDIVSRQGGYISINTARRLISKNAADMPFKYNTVDPVFKALAAEYSTAAEPEREHASAPDYAYPNYDRNQYEKLISILKDNCERLRAENERLKAHGEKQGRLLNLLWYRTLDQYHEDPENIS